MCTDERPSRDIDDDTNCKLVKSVFFGPEVRNSATYRQVELSCSRLSRVYLYKVMKFAYPERRSLLQATCCTQV
jgi:hypothetical protein